MAEIIIKGRVLNLRCDFTAYEQISKEIGNIVDLKEILQSMSEGESLACLKKLIRILANNYLDYIGEEQFITDKWLGHNLRVTKTAQKEYVEAIFEAFKEDFEREEQTEEEDKPVDVVLAKLQKKTTN